jgi:hypothetical protein
VEHQWPVYCRDSQGPEVAGNTGFTGVLAFLENLSSRHKKVSLPKNTNAYHKKAVDCCKSVFVFDKRRLKK